MMTSDDKEFVVVGYNGKIKFLTIKEDENSFENLYEPKEKKENSVLKDDNTLTKWLEKFFTDKENIKKLTYEYMDYNLEG